MTKRHDALSRHKIEVDVQNGKTATDLNQFVVMVSAMSVGSKELNVDDPVTLSILKKSHGTEPMQCCLP